MPITDRQLSVAKRIFRRAPPLKQAGVAVALACLPAALFTACAATPTRESTGQYVDDSAITSKVKTALLGDEAVKSFEIHVVTYKGVVQLSGFVDNQGQKDAAEKDAAAVPGVLRVTNTIGLRTSS